MITFTKASNQTSDFLIDFAGSEMLVFADRTDTISSVSPGTVTSGDVVLGTDAQAPRIMNEGTALVIWLSGGTADTEATVELTIDTLGGCTFSVSILVLVTHSTY